MGIIETTLGLDKALDVADDLGSGLRNTWDDLSGKSAADASKAAAQTQAGAQQQALDYLMKTEQLPQQFRESALTELAGLYGLNGGAGMGSQADMIEAAQASPIYRAIMGTQAGAEDAIMRNAAATGGLRSGNVQSNLARSAQELEQRALLEGYNQQLQERNQRISGLQGLAGMPSMAGQISSGISGIGQTLAQGQVAGAQAKQAGLGNLMNLGIGAYAASDIRLKDNIRKIGTKNGHNWYSWSWNNKASDLGLTGESEGFMAQEVAETMPEMVTEKDGYLAVNYEGVINA